MKVKFASIGRVRTRYLEEGSGPPLVLLHGIGHSGDVFFRNVDALAEHYRVIAPDLPGHGFSDHIPLNGRAPQPVFVEHLQRFFQAIDMKSYSLIGSSYGGLIASLLTLAAPHDVTKLVIVGSGGTFQESGEQKAALLHILANASSAMQAPTLASCRARLANICADTKSVAEEILLTQLTSYALEDRFDAFQEILAAYIASLDSEEDRVLGRLELISVPTLIITGRQDIRASVASHEQGHARMLSSKLVVFDQCGHLPYMEHPASFNQHVIDFLAG